MSFFEVQRGGGYSTGAGYGGGGYGGGGATGGFAGRGNAGAGFGGPYSGYQQPAVPREDETQLLAADINQISANVGQIKNLMNQLGTSRDSVDVRENLRTAIATTRTTAKHAGELLRRLETDSSMSGGGGYGASNDEITRKRNQQQKLAKDLQLWLQRFGEVAKAAAEKERVSPLPPKPPAASKQHYPTASNNYDEDDDDEKRGLIVAARNQQLALENEQKFHDILIQDREQDIRAIEKTVLEVNEIFLDLSKLVVEQGSLIDNIESNVERANAQVETGVQELAKASDYQKRSRTKLCFLALIVLVIVAAGGVLLYFLLK